jgi:predicted RNA binding protein YcfA (HicA-like mRNA interferase family)
VVGFETISQKGSHIKLRRTFGGVVYTAIVPNHKEVALGTLQSILKQAGITREELEENI